MIEAEMIGAIQNNAVLFFDGSGGIAPDACGFPWRQKEEAYATIGYNIAFPHFFPAKRTHHAKPLFSERISLEPIVPQCPARKQEVS